jgi:hypothetical protein
MMQPFAFVHVPLFAGLALQLIPPTKLAELQHLLAYLLKRSESKEFRKMASAAAKKKQRSLLEHGGMQERADIGEIDAYTEMMYEDVPEKIRASGLILQIAFVPDNLERIVQHEAMIGALSRELREEGGKNMELGSNIVHIYFFLSSFTVFHDFLRQHKIGAQCLQILSKEIKRAVQLDEKMGKIQLKIKAKKYSEEEAKTKLQAHHDSCFNQERLIYVSLHLLLNLAEDTRVQMKMASKGLIGNLLTFLERENPELLILVVAFLKRLSIFAENKNRMKEDDIIKQVAPLVHSENPELVKGALPLLLNLSFDSDLRARMVELGLLPQFVNLMQHPKIPNDLPLKLLYHISLDDANKPLFSSTDCLPTVMQMILSSKSDRLPIELMALCINLAASQANAEAICENRGLDILMKRFAKTHDPLLLKMIRNISIHDGPLKELFLEHVDMLAGMIVNERCSEELLVEALGILGNITIPHFNYEKLLTDFDLLLWMNDHLLPDAADDDLVLQVVVLLGTLLVDESCAEQVARSGIVQNLIELLKAKQEDDEIVLQIVFVFYKLVYHEATRGLVLGQTTAVSYLIDLMHDKNVEIRKVCDSALDIIMAFAEDWAQQIRLQKFQFHNAQWLEAVVDADGYDEGAEGYRDEYDEGYTGNYQMHDANELDQFQHDYYEGQPQEGDELYEDMEFDGGGPPRGHHGGYSQESGYDDHDGTGGGGGRMAPGGYVQAGRYDTQGSYEQAGGGGFDTQAAYDAQVAYEQGGGTRYSIDV